MPTTSFTRRRDPEIDTIILACTHYPLLLNTILKHVPRGVRVVPQGEYVASSLVQYMQRHPEMENRITQGGTCHYLTTENPERFTECARVFLKEDVDVENVTLG